MRKIFFFLSLSLWMITSEAVVIDQSYNSPQVGFYASVSGIQQAQTFTVGVNGFLSGVSLDLFSSTSPFTPDPLQFYIIDTENGLPINNYSNPLAYKQFDVSEVPAENTATGNSFFIDVSNQNIEVSIGDVLAVAVFTNDTDDIIDYWWVGGTTDEGYSGGKSLFRKEGMTIDYGIYGIVDYTDWGPNILYSDATRGDGDFNFTTYVKPSNVPIPQTFWLFGSCVFCLIRLIKRKT